MDLVINASPLIFLAKLELIQIVPLMVDKLIVPKAVFDEIQKCKDKASIWLFENELSYSIEAITVPDFIKAWDLGCGETEVIALAHENTGYVVALDDRAARNCALSLNVEVIGTIGLILLAKKKFLIPDATSYLYKLKTEGYRISNLLFEHALNLAQG